MSETLHTIVYIAIILTMIAGVVILVNNLWNSDDTPKIENVTLDRESCKDWVRANNITVPNETQITYCIINRRT